MRTRINKEEGSMFILVLLVLLILTAVALSLVFVTEIEMQMGANERILTETFYGAESGVHAALSGIPNQNWAGEKIAFVDGPLGKMNRKVGTRIITSRVHAVGPPQVPPMSLANEGELEYFSFSLAMRSVAERVSWPAIDEVPIYETDQVPLLEVPEDEEPPPPLSPEEREVYILSQRTITVRYLMSPVRRPASGEEPYSDESQIDL